MNFTFLLREVVFDFKRMVWVEFIAFADRHNVIKMAILKTGPVIFPVVCDSRLILSSF